MQGVLECILEEVKKIRSKKTGEEFSIGILTTHGLTFEMFLPGEMIFSIGMPLKVGCRLGVEKGRLVVKTSIQNEH